MRLARFVVVDDVCCLLFGFWGSCGSVCGCVGLLMRDCVVWCYLCLGHWCWCENCVGLLGESELCGVGII